MLPSRQTAKEPVRSSRPCHRLVQLPQLTTTTTRLLRSSSDPPALLIFIALAANISDTVVMSASNE